MVGNPPFLGGKLMRDGLGDDYVDRLFAAALVGLGAFGIIHSVLVRTVSIFLLETNRQRVPYDDGIKQAMTGYGKADKKEIQQIMQQLLGLPKLPRPDDAADALAMALLFVLGLWLITTAFALGYRSVALQVSDVASGALVILFAWLLTWIYIRWANSHYDAAIRGLRR